MDVCMRPRGEKKPREDARRQDDAASSFAARNSNFSERRRACAPSFAEIKNKSRKQQSGRERVREEREEEGNVKVHADRGALA